MRPLHRAPRWRARRAAPSSCSRSMARAGVRVQPSLGLQDLQPAGRQFQALVDSLQGAAGLFLDDLRQRFGQFFSRSEGFRREGKEGRQRLRSRTQAPGRQSARRSERLASRPAQRLPAPGWPGMAASTCQGQRMHPTFQFDTVTNLAGCRNCAGHDAMRCGACRCRPLSG